MPLGYRLHSKAGLCEMFEYKVVPAPSKGRKARGVKGPEARFAHALETTMNILATEGWEFQRADILPSDERQGLTSTQTVYRSVLVFRRPLTSQVALDTQDAPSEDIDDFEGQEDDDLSPEDTSMDDLDDDAQDFEEPEQDKVQDHDDPEVEKA